MIGKIAGRLDWKGLDTVLIDCRGVGYIVHVNDRTLAALPPVGEACALYTDLLVREDLLQLFGFPTMLDREWHKLLMTVQGGSSNILYLSRTLGFELEKGDPLLDVLSAAVKKNAALGYDYVAAPASAERSLSFFGARSKPTAESSGNSRSRVSCAPSTLTSRLPTPWLCPPAACALKERASNKARIRMYIAKTSG